MTTLTDFLNALHYEIILSTTNITVLVVLKQKEKSTSNKI